MRPLGAWLVAGLASAQLFGCASPPPGARSVLAGNPVQNLLILPLNVAAVMPAELEGASPAVWEELEIYLRELGKELKTVAFRDARRLWIESIKEARAADARAGYEDAARVLVGKLSRHAAFDAVIAPSLYLREARISGRSAQWDGVERELEIESATRLSADVPLEGVAPAASLHAVVLDAQGNKLQEALGGLDVLVGVRVVRGRGWGSAAIHLEYVTRTDLFSSHEDLHEGIARALEPLLPPVPPPAD